jgi:hypothetical protein
MRFEFLTAVTVTFTIFLVVTPCRLVDRCWCKHREDAFHVYRQYKPDTHLGTVYKIATFIAFRYCIK